MKLLFLIPLILFTSCTSSNQYGKCIGIMDEPKPNLTYEYSTWNIVVGSVFVSTIFVPTIVTIKELKCPTGVK